MTRFETRGNLPHACDKLDETAIAKREGDDNVGGGEATGADVDQAEDEGGQGEGGQTERSGVAEFPLFHAAVQTRLEFTSEGGQQGQLPGLDVGKRTVAKLGRIDSGMAFFGGHVGGDLLGLDRAVGGCHVVGWCGGEVKAGVEVRVGGGCRGARGRRSRTGQRAARISRRQGTTSVWHARDKAQREEEGR